ncbi:MAG: NAD(P)-binding domain-containing protein [Chloroflexota bacterium]|nr:NAD(P)-binding domain-containing protein [Chloroflexota bacterium]
MATQQTDLLIIGAGPYGLAMAAHATHLGIDHLIVGEPMSFWRAHMPAGMLLRSATDWHLDPANLDTIEAYLASRGEPSDAQPLSLDLYLDYAAWFQRQKGIESIPEHVHVLRRRPDRTFLASLSRGDSIASRRVVIALGFGAFRHVPDELATILPEGSFGHTRDEVDFTPLAGKRVLIIGGRQSAYEWAALLREAGSADVTISHRHAAPAFAESDWSWVVPMVDLMADDPGWYRRLDPASKESIVDRLYAEGRLKVEPWLQPRVERDGIHVVPETRLVRCGITGESDYLVTFDDHRTISVDRVILATGYKVEIDRLPFLAAGNILPNVRTSDGFPELDERFQTSVPGLFITSMPATRDFGPFFAFTIAARMSARVIGAALTR